jgi:Uncharacterised protein family (UPF0197).
MDSLPLGLQPFIAPVSDKLHFQLTLVLFSLGFALFSWLFVYQVTYPKVSRSLLKEVLLAICVSILWGFAGLFGMLSAGVYL